MNGVKIHGSGKLKVGPVEVSFDNQGLSNYDSLDFDSLDPKQISDIMEKTREEVAKLNGRLKRLQQALRRRK